MASPSSGGAGNGSDILGGVRAVGRKRIGEGWERMPAGSDDVIARTDGVFGLEYFLVIFCVVDFRRRHFFVGLVLAGAPPLTFRAPPIGVTPLLYPDEDGPKRKCSKM